MAPVTVGKRGHHRRRTTVTRNVADNELVLSRVPQVHKQGWRRPVKKSDFVGRISVSAIRRTEDEEGKNNPHAP